MPLVPSIRKTNPLVLNLSHALFSILNHYTSINPHHLQGYIKSLGRSLALSFSSVRTDLASLCVLSTNTLYLVRCHRHGDAWSHDCMSSLSCLCYAKSRNYTCLLCLCYAKSRNYRRQRYASDNLTDCSELRDGEMFV